jgi:hypothetical protein
MAFHVGDRMHQDRYGLGNVIDIAGLHVTIARTRHGSSWRRWWH